MRNSNLLWDVLANVFARFVCVGMEVRVSGIYVCLCVSKRLSLVTVCVCVSKSVNGGYGYLDLVLMFNLHLKL